MKDLGLHLRGILGLLLVAGAAGFGQTKPPVNTVPEPYRQRFVRYVDDRSFTEKALNAVGFTGQDVGRSFALIAGVSKYPQMPVPYRRLDAASVDVDKLASYLTTQEFFDEVVVLKDGEVTDVNLKFFLDYYFPQRLKKFPKSRFLFAYSGHGISIGEAANPTGYLLTSNATSFDDLLNSINMSVLRAYLDRVVKQGYQTLVLINACHSGDFFSPVGFGNESLLPRHPGAHAITAGGTDQNAWANPKIGPGSVFFEELFAGLSGAADSLPVSANGRRGDGIITEDEIASYLVQEVYGATSHLQTPIAGDLKFPNRSEGSFFFLNRGRMVEHNLVPDWNPKIAVAMGADDDPGTERGETVNANVALDENSPQGSYFYRGYMYAEGIGGVKKDDAEAVKWYQKAADAGDARGMTNLGLMYENGRGGLPKSDAEAVKWYQKAADAGDARGMTSLGVMYEEGRGGLPKSDAEAVKWYQKDADAGDDYGKAYLGSMYELGRGGLPVDLQQALNLYREAASMGNDYAKDALKRLGQP